GCDPCRGGQQSRSHIGRERGPCVSRGGCRGGSRSHFAGGRHIGRGSGRQQGTWHSRLVGPWDELSSVPNRVSVLHIVVSPAPNGRHAARSEPIERSCPLLDRVDRL